MNEKLTAIQKTSLSSIKNKLNQLPMLPTVVSRMMMLDKNSDSFQEDVLKLITEDPTFAARVIQLANSAFSHPTVPILTLRDAVIRMGSDSISSLVTSLGVLKVFVPTTQGQKNLWAHSIQTAITAREIATLSRYHVISKEEAYLCGLMHDIGRFIMFSESPENLARVDESNWKDPKELVEVEREICGFDHAEMGWHACQSWQMPELVTNIVRYHHDYHFKKTTSARIKKVGRIIRLIQMADFFSVVMLTTEDFLSLEDVEIRKLINDRCIISTWPEIPIAITKLADISKLIYKESESLIKNLGLN